MLRLASLTLLLLMPTVSMPALSNSAHAQALPGGAQPVLTQAGRAPLVVVAAQTEESWERGARRLLRREWPTEVARAASVSHLPAETRRALLGTYRLSNGSRQVCVARLGRPMVFRHVRLNAYVSDEGLAPGEVAMTSAQVAELAWERAQRSYLVAPVEAVRGDCASATWAARRRMRFSSAIEPDAATLAAFRALEVHREFAAAWLEVREQSAADDPDQAEPADEALPPEQWDARAGGVHRAVARIELGGRTFTLIAAEADVGCGSFTGAMWAVFESGEDGPRLVASERDHDLLPRLADLDSDGLPEVVGGQRFVSIVGGPSTDFSAIDLGCPC